MATVRKGAGRKIFKGRNYLRKYGSQRLPKNFWCGSLASKSTLKEQYFIDSEPKGEVISSKIDRLAAIYISKFKWVWRAQSLSHIFQILEMNLSFEADELILLYY